MVAEETVLFESLESDYEASEDQVWTIENAIRLAHILIVKYFGILYVRRMKISPVAAKMPKCVSLKLPQMLEETLKDIADNNRPLVEFIEDACESENEMD